MLASTAQDQNAPASQVQPPPAPAPKRSAKRHHKKTSTPDCSSSPGGTAPAPATDNSREATSKRCPPPITVIKNGGSNEPTIELKGNATADQKSQQRSTTEQLAMQTEENLKKFSVNSPSPTQQETLTQIKQFMEQSKEAVAAGDLERGRNLAVKAHLLSEELVKPK
jgi:hypothetical protein